MRNLKAAALIPLLLLPNFLFMVPIVSAATTPQSQPPGTSLPPGTVTARNTWDLTQTCPASPATVEPLHHLSSWNTTLSIPTLLFMGQPQGYILESFSVLPSGEFAVSDNDGNSFSFTIPVIASGTQATLVGNSSMAVLQIEAATGSATRADVKVTLSVYTQSCEPAGVRLEISGTADWGPADRGAISVAFAQRALSASGERAIFSNRSGVGLGFDWSDSTALKPSFDAKTSTLSYDVGPSFDIDPYTVTTVSNSMTILSNWQNTFLAAGRYWVFWCDPTSSFEYTSSVDGETWLGPTSIGTCSANYFSGTAHFDGRYLYYAYTDYFTGSTYFQRGVPNADGSVTWSASQQTVISGGGGGVKLHIAVDSAGHPWLTYVLGSTAFVLMDANTDGTWTTSTGFPYSGIHSGMMGTAADCSIQSLRNSKMLVLCGGGGTSTLFGSEYNSGWQTTQSFSAYYIGSTNSGFQAASIGDTTYIVFLADPELYGSSTLYWTTFSASTNSFGVASSLATSCSSCSPSVVLDPSDNNLLAYWSQGSSVYYYSRFNGATWSSPTPAVSLGAMPTYGCSFETSSLAWGSQVEMLFETGDSSPYSVSFAAVPSTVPTATFSQSPWARAGLSPYESYFNEFSDYVSPGNGLVSLDVATLDLPGKGLDFVASVEYSEPYALGPGGSSYQYDNYTGANLGLGWSLNFPWLGTSYLHLGDGQAYPYSWNGSTFQYNGVTDFVLTKNTGGTYTLNMSSGILYRFDTSKELTSITDRTGNDRISFSYGSNGYISQVTDTIGRTIAFSYDSGNRLTGIAEGGRSWTLGYTGNQLTSMTDALSRQTTFYYAGTSGADEWLLSSVVWPTGGKVTYTYGSGAVGTEVSTYYAVLRNVYYDSTHLSLTQQIDPVLVNGQMVWSNNTISDGTSIHEYLNYSFQSSPKSVMKVFAYDGTKTLQRVTETDSDSAGRTNATKIYSPSGLRLAKSTFAYDNWGNLIYSNDSVGQQTWFSYANTNSDKSFGSSGCSTSFYTQTINPNIHDLMVGSCDYQNGAGTAQQETYYSYGTNGNLLEAKVSHSSGWLDTDYTYDSYGNVLSMKNANGNTTYYRYSPTYSSAYLTKKSIMAGTQNVTTTYTYELATGNMLSQTDPNGQTTSYTYDALGRNTQVAYPAVGGSVAYTNYYYYDTNNTMKTVDANGHVTKTYFDGLARQTEVQRWNGTSAYSAETYTYNWVDRVATKTTATSNTYTYSYDWAGRLTRLTNPDNTYQTTSYSDASNTKTMTDENGHQTVYSYDWDQRLTTVKQYNSSSNYYLTTYSYDLSGNMLSVTDASSPGQTTSYTYDDLNRLIQATFPTSPSTTESRTYDSVGNLLTLKTANMTSQSISYTYDALNRLTKVTYPGSGGTVNYTYDQDGNRKLMVSPSARDYYSYDNRDRLTNLTEYVGGVKYQTLYSYDAVGDVTQLTYPDSYALTMSYDAANRPKTVGSFATISYTVDDRVSKITYGNGEVQTYTYDTRDRPTQIQDKYGNVKKLSLNYTYDGTGNVLTLNNENYHYDWLNRLNYSSGPWTTVTYAYDQVGNRVRMVQGSTTTYTYGPFDRLASAGSTSYTYDANGNIATKSGGWTYSYDYANRLTRVTQSGTAVQTNAYDGDGSRVQQVAGSSTYTYSYEGLNILYEKNVTGGTTTATKHFYADGLQVAKMVGPTTYYLHQDALGSVRLEATSSGTITFSSNYVPYGSSYGASGKEVFMYTGEPYSSVTGLYLFGARYYDPAIGRFITEDSYAGDDNDPTTLNRYVYARDNPERYTDPSGRVFIDESGVLYVASGTALRAAGVIPPTVAATTSSTVTVATSSSTAVASSASDTSAASTTSVTGTSYRSPDVTLTSSGNDQYAEQEVGCGWGICWGYEPSGAFTTWENTGAAGTGANWGQIGSSAGALTIPAAGAGAALYVTTAAANPIEWAPLIGGLAFASGFAIGYTIRTAQSGQTPTWQGSGEAFAQGFEVIYREIPHQIFSWISSL